jgi:hypothetical protein
MRRDDGCLEFHALDRKEELSSLDFGSDARGDLYDDTWHGRSQDFIAATWRCFLLRLDESVERFDSMCAPAKMNEVDVTIARDEDALRSAVDRDPEFALVSSWRERDIDTPAIDGQCCRIFDAVAVRRVDDRRFVVELEVVSHRFVLSFATRPWTHRAPERR